jgi:hypothetical protein
LALPELERKRISDALNIGLHGIDMKGKSKSQKGKKQVVDYFYYEAM